MQKKILISIILLIVIGTGAVYFILWTTKPNANHQSPSSSTNQAADTLNSNVSLKSVSQCKGDLSSLSTRDKDTCYGIDATESADAALCDNITNDTRKDLCHMRIARVKGDDKLCSPIIDSTLKTACVIYSQDINPTGDSGKNIALSQMDHKIQNTIDDIETRFINGDIPEDKLQSDTDQVLDSHQNTVIRDKLTI